ncbi:MAG: hypothetical protein GY730_02620 [bacterium]|nr:hypothetical protein [bacterium]
MSTKRVTTDYVYTEIEADSEAKAKCKCQKLIFEGADIFEDLKNCDLDMDLSTDFQDIEVMGTIEVKI